MSKSIKLLAMFAVVAGVSACAQQEEEEYIVVDPEPISIEPISVEPMYTGKYK